jgi:hypothetical protein
MLEEIMGAAAAAAVIAMEARRTSAEEMQDQIMRQDALVVLEKMTMTMMRRC